MIQKLLWRLFPPFEVKLTREAIDGFLGSRAKLCGSIIGSGAHELVDDTEKTLYSIRINHMKPDQLALILITNVLGRHLQSGQYHTYRGVLNMMGKDMLKVWDAAGKEMLDRRYHDESEAKKDHDWIRHEIEGVG